MAVLLAAQIKIQSLTFNQINSMSFLGQALLSGYISRKSRNKQWIY